ncbi:Isochorismatase [Thelotrema lepadinum]|nr:Isochorismatase [Thelotrema lepadinum]
MPQRVQSRPALTIIDMQNSFYHPSGSFSKSGLPTMNHMAISEDYSDAGLLADTIPNLKDNKGLIRGTRDVEILDDLKPRPEDTIITKTRNTAFWQTKLEELLRERGINQIIATGVGTNVCVESTIRDAWTNGFCALNVTDATATLTQEEHEASLLSIK